MWPINQCFTYQHLGNERRCIRCEVVKETINHFKTINHGIYIFLLEKEIND